MRCFLYVPKSCLTVGVELEYVRLATAVSVLVVLDIEVSLSCFIFACLVTGAVDVKPLFCICTLASVSFLFSIDLDRLIICFAVGLTCAPNVNGRIGIAVGVFSLVHFPTQEWKHPEISLVELMSNRLLFRTDSRVKICVVEDGVLTL